MRFFLAAASTSVFAAFALGQVPLTTLTATTDKQTIAAEAVEVVRLKPDTMKMHVKVETKHTDATTANDETAEAYKQFADGIAKLKLAGVTMNALQQRSFRVDVMNNNRAAGGAQTTIEYRTSRPIILTVTNPDFDKLTATAEKLQLEATKLGVTSDLAANNYTYTPIGQERNSPFRTVITRKGGWDEVLGPALEKATKRAKAKAEAPAAGAGVRLGEVVSVQEIPSPQTYNYSYSSSYNTTNPILTEPEDEYHDGELVRKVRVRVVYAVAK